MFTTLKPALRHVAVAALPFALAFVSQSPAKALGVPNRTQIPFSFQVGNEQLPAGEYTLTRLFHGNAYALKNLKSGKSVLISVPPSAGPRPVRLFFKSGPNGRQLQSAR